MRRGGNREEDLASKRKRKGCNLNKWRCDMGVLVLVKSLFEGGAGGVRHEKGAKIAEIKGKGGIR